MVTFDTGGFGKVFVGGITVKVLLVNKGRAVVSCEVVDDLLFVLDVSDVKLLVGMF